VPTYSEGLRQRRRRYPRRATRISITLVVAALASAMAASAPGEAKSSPGTTGHGSAARMTHTVTYDHYSLKIDGRRLYVWSGEFHYWRLPSPSLWRDVLQKMKAAGYNAASIYFDWGYHSPKPGVYDFSGVRNVDRLLTIADQVGIYVIARPGPYINAETDSGGFPAWLDTQKGRARSSAPDYTAAYTDWLRHVDPIIARHQLTNGTGSVILYQVENEYGSNTDAAYMEQLERQVRADGITVPLTHNHCCGSSTWATGPGAVDIPGQDSYPQGFDCSNPTRWSGVSSLPRFRDDAPIFTPEFQGGSFDPWGGPGYDNCRQLTGPDFENVFYKENIIGGATLQSFYMTYGGTSWGWLADPQQVYSSYDYGAAIKEDRELTSKYDEQKRLGYMLASVAPLTKSDQVAAAPATDPSIRVAARANPDDGTHFYELRHSDSTSTANDQTHIAIDLSSRGAYTYDDVDPALTYSGTGWSHVSNQSYTTGDYRDTESFSDHAGDNVSVKFTGTAVRWISSRDPSHGISDVYLDGTKVATVDGYAPGKEFQSVFYAKDGLPAGPHTLTIVATATKDAAATGAFTVVDAIDTPTGAAAGDLYPSVPQEPGTKITLNGRDAKLLVAGYDMDGQRLQYSTSELMTHGRIGNRDIALFYGRQGEDGETVLRYSRQPSVRVLSGRVKSTWDPDRGDLRLNYVHQGLARVLIRPSGGTPLELLVASDQVAARFWRQDTAAGPVLVRGPELVRTGSVSGGTLALTGDTTARTAVEIWAPPGVTSITFNGRALALASGPDGSSQTGTVAGPKPVSLPALRRWRFQRGSPEAQPRFDDSNWTLADKTTTNNPTQPTTLPVLYADEYGFHHGDVWYRGHFRAVGSETGVDLSAITGRAGIYSAWLNGRFLGSSDDATHRFDFPAGSVHAARDNVLSVMVENMGHNEDFNADDSHKQPRGLTGAAIVGSSAQLRWRIQGSLGGENLVDPVRGPMNTGGLFGERSGWSLPEFPDRSWRSVTLPHRDTEPGETWYRTTFALNLPRDQDVPIGIKISDDSARHYRALIYVNGWLIGRYINDTGPENSFPVPPGLMRADGTNTVAIGVWNQDATTGGLGAVSLQRYANLATSLRVQNVRSPGYNALAQRLGAGAGGQPSPVH
jgi:beta-galactosidase GanA